MDDTKTTDDLTNLPWDEIKNIATVGDFKEKYGNIPEDTFRFASKPENHEAIVESAWKSLKQTNPEATHEQAASLADMMQIFARMVVTQLDEKNKSSKR